MAAVQAAAAAAASLPCTLNQSRQLLRVAGPFPSSSGSFASKAPRPGLVCVASASSSGGGAEQHLALDVRSSPTAAPPDVKVDNEASDEYTVITVSADNRPGLLQLLTLTFRDLGLDVAKAVVDLDSSGRVADQFFVVDDKGNKVQKSKDIQVLCFTRGRGHACFLPEVHC